MSREYLVEGIFPTGSVNIICGPSGAGKTTLMFQSFQDWLLGLDVLGRASIQDADRRKLFYIAADRDEDDVRELLERTNVTNIPFVAILDSTDVNMYLRAAPEGTSLLYIDGASVLVPGGRINDNDTVFKFMRGLRVWAKAHKCAILLSCHSPKRWKGEELINPRESILGSIAWGAAADTVMIMQEDNPKNPDDTSRTVVVEARHQRKRFLKFKYDETDGRLAEQLSDADQAGAMTLLVNMTKGEIYTRKALVEQGATRNMSASTVDRVLKKWLKEGRVKKDNDGEYVKV